MWFRCLAVVVFGLIIGLLVIIAINTHPRTAGLVEVKQLEAKIGQHIILPTDETPALATVTDTSKLKNNKFLSQGKNGDKILIYAKWQRAVLYRPSADRVVDIGPVDVTPPGGDTSGFAPVGKQ